MCLSSAEVVVGWRWKKEGVGGERGEGGAGGGDKAVGKAYQRHRPRPYETREERERRGVRVRVTRGRRHSQYCYGRAS